MENIYLSTPSTSSISSSIHHVLSVQSTQQPHIAANLHTLILMPSNTLHKRQCRRVRDLYLSNGMIEPGRPISRAEREARKDSVLNDPEEDETNCASSGRQESDQHYDWTPFVLPIFGHERRFTQSRINLHGLILSVIAVLLVFGALWSIVEYLLVNTRASAQCTPSTVYLPVTETVIPCSVPATTNVPVAGSSLPTISFTTILTTTVAYTQTITVLATLTPSTTAASGQPSDPPPLSYMVNSGVTTWLGASPSSGLSIAFASMIATVTIEPSPITQVTSRTTTVTSTLVITFETTITLSSSAGTSAASALSATPAVASSQVTPTATIPPFTSTYFSMINPELTTTLTRTRTTTISLSLVTAHSSFTGIKTNGWNTSSAAENVQPVQPTTRTFSELYYFGTGSVTTSTSTSLITTTIGATITQTFVPTPFVASVSGVLTTITGTPAILTYTVQAQPSVASVSILDITSAIPQTAAFSSNTAASSLVMPSGLVSATVFPLSPVSPTGYSSASSGLSSLPSGAPSDSSIAGPLYSNTSSSVSALASTTLDITFTSSFSGRGTTFLTTSGPVNSMTNPLFSPATGTPIPASTAISGSTIIISRPPSDASVNTNSATDSASSPVSNKSGSISGPMPSIASESDLTSIALTSGITITLHGSPTVSASSPATTRTGSISASSVSTGSVSGFNSIALTSGVTVNMHGSTTGRRTSSSSNTGSSSMTSASSQSSMSSRNSSASLQYTSQPATSPASHTSSSSFSNPFPPSSATATPSRGCGEQGDFTMTFDDLPFYAPTKRQWNQTNDTAITQYPPLNQRPYHHLLFSGGYVYAPNPAEPFAPASSPNVAAFVEPNVLKSMPGSRPNMTEPGEIGEIPHGDNNSTFWFNPQSVYLGCDNDGPDDCTMQATGYQYDPQPNDEVPGPQENFTVPPCIGYRNCKLQRFVFPDTFQNLSGIQFRAFVDNQPRMYFIDNLNMRWSNASCEAGLERQGSR